MSSLKTVAWTLQNKSGMHRVAESICLAEKTLGIDSHIANPLEPDDGRFDHLLDADVHILHTHVPDSFKKKITKKYKQIYVIHGTPDHIFQTAVEEGSKKSYGHSDSWMLTQRNMQVSDAIVTFWPRHQAIWKSLCDKNTKVHCLPLGVDKTFWKKIPTRGKYAGSPSVFTAENQHYIKWSWDIFVAWPWIVEQTKGNPVLHNPYLPQDMHRWFFPLINRNGTSYAGHISPLAFDHDNLKNAFCSVDYFIGLVQKGDFNRLCLEANSCEVPTISYCGNPYSSYWINEGSQVEIAKQVAAILNKEVEPRKDKEMVPDILETAKGMLEVYESLF